MRPDRQLAHVLAVALPTSAAILLLVGVAETARARPVSILAPDALQARLSDLARGGAPDYVDTLWFGGTGPDGLGVPGGVWDFEDGTLQGWTSEDRTDDGLVRRVEQSDFGGQPAVANINGGSLWFGAFEYEAAEGCWPGGMGYSNDWIATATKSFTYEGDQGVIISFQYFVDSETQFDIAYVILESSAGKDTLNTSIGGHHSTGLGYSGSHQEGTPIGSPDTPAFEQIIVPHSEMPPFGEEYTLQLRFDSDGLYSDGLDSFAGYLNSVYGAFGVDEVFVETPRDGLPSLFDISTFDVFYDGWVTGLESVGSLMEVAPIVQLDPTPMGPDCPLAVIGNEYALIAADRHGGEPHPPRAQAGGITYFSTQR